MSLYKRNLAKKITAVLAAGTIMLGSSAEGMTAMGAAAACLLFSSSAISAEPPAEVFQESSEPVVRMTIGDIRSLNGGKVPITVSGNAVTFVGGKFCEGLVRNEKDALRAAKGLLELAGAASNTEIRIAGVTELRDGTRIYNAVLTIDGRDAANSSMKLIVDPDYAPAGMVSSIGISTSDYRMTTAEAIRIVQKNAQGANVIEDAACMEVVPVSDISGQETSQLYGADTAIVDLTADIHSRSELVHCIYTDVPGGDPDEVRKHYVTLDGRYLYSLPAGLDEALEQAASGGASDADNAAAGAVRGTPEQAASGGASGADNAAAGVVGETAEQVGAAASESMVEEPEIPSAADAAAENISFYDVIGNMTSRTFSAKVTLHDGSSRTVTVPAVRQGKDDPLCMIDEERQIVAADAAAYAEGRIEPLTLDKDHVNNTAMLAAEAFSSIYDLCKEQGFVGTDGRKQPILLLFDDEQEESAVYLGEQSGWQVFSFKNEGTFGENIDLVGEVFADYMTQLALGGSWDLNDCGAIRLGLCRIFGELFEAMIDPTVDDAKWERGQTTGESLGALGSPRADNCPQFIYDSGYVPNAVIPTAENDFGGVHTNASILGYCAYRMMVRGMSVEDELDFWMYVMNSITPETSFRQLDEILEWAVVQNGNSEMKEKLSKITSYLGFTGSGIPYKKAYEAAFNDLYGDLISENAAAAAEAGAEIAGTEVTGTKAGAENGTETAGTEAAGVEDDADTTADSAPEAVAEVLPVIPEMLVSTSASKTLAEGSGAVIFKVERTAAMYFGRPMISFSGADGEVFETWPEEGSQVVCAVLPEGEYTVKAVLYDPASIGTGAGETSAELVFDGENWTEQSTDSTVISVESGKVTLLNGAGLEDYPLEGIENFETAYAAAQVRNAGTSEADKSEAGDDAEPDVGEDTESIDDFWNDVN